MIGVDIVKVSRIADLKNKEKFLEKVFTKSELSYIAKKKNRDETIAGFFAAKEAISKVFGTGIGKISFYDMEIFHDTLGKPYVELTEEGQKKLYKLGLSQIELSISHEKDFAIATAIGVSREYKNRGKLFYQADMAMSLLKRDRYGHKGNYGKVCIIGGSEGMLGSIYMSGLAAFRAGSGLVYNMVPREISNVLQIKAVEQIVISIEDEGKSHFSKASINSIIKRINDFDAIAIGPGMGRHTDNLKIIEAVLEKFKGHLVIDADGLNALALDKSILLKAKNRPILTPHLKEFERLVDRPIKDIIKNKKEIAQNFARKYNCILLVKGPDTLITDGSVYYLNNTGNPGMATAGSGDILTGIIASFLGQGYNDLLSARLGAYIHGLSGDLTREEFGETGMIASDMIVNISKAIKALQEMNDEL